MAVDRNRITERDIEASYEGPTWCFPAVESDTNYIIDPDTTDHPDVPLVSAAISLSAVAAIKVELWNKRVVTIPSGALQAGVRYPLHIVKVWSTGTGVTDVLIWRGESLRDLRPTTY